MVRNVSKTQSAAAEILCWHEKGDISFCSVLRMAVRCAVDVDMNAQECVCLSVCTVVDPKHGWGDGDVNRHKWSTCLHCHSDFLIASNVLFSAAAKDKKTSSRWYIAFFSSVWKHLAWVSKPRWIPILCASSIVCYGLLRLVHCECNTNWSIGGQQEITQWHSGDTSLSPFVLMWNHPRTRKSSCVNARGIPTAAYQVLLGGVPPHWGTPCQVQWGDTWGGVPPVGYPPSQVWQGGTRGGAPPPGPDWGTPLNLAGVRPWLDLARVTPPLGVDRQMDGQTRIKT